MTYNEATAKYIMTGILRDLNGTGSNLIARGQEIKSFADKVQVAMEDPANIEAFMSPKSAFFENLMRAFEDADYSQHLTQSRKSALSTLVGAYASMSD